MTHTIKRILCIAIGLFALGGIHTVHAQKKPLDHTSYALWSRITENKISDDGQWVLYAYSPEEHDGSLKIRSITGNKEFTIIRGDSAGFSPNSMFVVTKIKAPVDSVKKAKRAKKKGSELPQDSLAIINLSDGSIIRRGDVLSYRIPKKHGEWLAYRLVKKDTSETEEKDKPKGKITKIKEGSDLVVMHLGDKQEKILPYVTSYTFDDHGNWLAFTEVSKDSLRNGIYIMNLSAGTISPLLTGPGNYSGMTFDDDGQQLVFLSDQKDHLSKQPSYSLYYWKADESSAHELITENTRGIPENWWISKYGDLSFSKDGKRIFFGTKPKPEPPPEKKIPDDEKVNVDIWSWTDPLIQPQQLKEVDKEKKRTYLAYTTPKGGKSIQLASEEIPTVHVGKEGNADVAVGLTNMPYRQEISWDYPEYYDIYLIDVKSGKREKVLTKLQSGAELSPDARYIDWWDRDKLAWFSMDVRKHRIVNLTGNIPTPMQNELHDWPYKPNPYGRAGWTPNDKNFVVYDRFDIWDLDPTGKKTPRNITDGVGRQDSIRFRYIRLDHEEKSIDPSKSMLLSGFNITTKADGFYRDEINVPHKPSQLIVKDESFSTPVKAKDDNELFFTRETFREFPDLWVSDLNFDNLHRISDVNPQQKEFLWGSSELVHFTSIDGKPLQGILYKPANFDPHKKYPMIVYFYERNSDYVHRYWIPAPGRSIINFSFYASRGYLIFVPDIPYKVGYPGQSALDAVMPGTLHIIDKGFVDTKNIGVQGHSWGGYQVAYLVTQTNMFKAAESGAPVSDMISAYGGIRWGSGMSREFQYEKTQSRIGGSLWEYPLRYIENSPVYWADKIQTPLLILHNDHDTAVPWYQGIELFLALRRLHKPTWLLNYNDEPHWPTKYQNRMDFTTRMQQFFDYYLKGAPPPVWLIKGVPAIDKGKTLGLKLMDKK